MEISKIKFQGSEVNVIFKITSFTTRSMATLLLPSVQKKALSVWGTRRTCKSLRFTLVILAILTAFQEIVLIWPKSLLKRTNSDTLKQLANLPNTIQT